MNEKKSKNIQLVLIIITVILVIITGLLITRRIIKKNNANKTTSENSNIIEEHGDWNIEDITDFKDKKIEQLNFEDGETKNIELNNQYTILKLDDNLELELLGEKIKENQYKYYLYIEKERKNNYPKTELEDSKEKLIYSSNVKDTSFSISKYKNFYIIKSTVKNEQNGEYIAAIYKDGKRSLSLYNVTAEFDKELKDIKVKKCFKDDCITSKYQISDKYEGSINYVSRDKDMTKEQIPELLKSIASEKYNLPYNINEYEIIISDESEEREGSIGAYNVLIKKENSTEKYRVEKTGTRVAHIIGYEGYTIA